VSKKLGAVQEEVAWLRKAVAQRSPQAQYKLAMLYYLGWGVAKDYEEALKWYRLAAESGYRWAQHDLGQMYRDARGTDQDHGRAVKWFRRAAEQDDLIAQHALGIYYRAAGKGNISARRAVGDIHSKNGDASGYFVHALKWYTLAHWYSKARRDAAALAATMNPADVALAKKLAREWRP